MGALWLDMTHNGPACDKMNQHVIKYIGMWLFWGPSVLRALLKSVEVMWEGDNGRGVIYSIYA